MTFYIDINEKKLVQSLTSTKSVPTPIFMKGDNEPLDFYLCEKNSDGSYSTKILEPNKDFLRVAIARFNAYPKVLSYVNSYTIKENGAIETTLPLNTQELKNALEGQKSLSALLEVQLSNIDGTIITVLQTACTVKNELITDAPATELEDEYYTKEEVKALLENLKDDEISSKVDTDVLNETLLEYYTKSQVETLLNNLKNNEISSKVDSDVLEEKLLDLTDMSKTYQGVKLQAYDEDGNAIQGMTVGIKIKIENDIPTIIFV